MEITLKIADEERFIKALMPVYLFSDEEPFADQLKQTLINQLIAAVEQSEENDFVQKARNERVKEPMVIE